MGLLSGRFVLQVPHPAGGKGRDKVPLLEQRLVERRGGEGGPGGQDQDEDDPDDPDDPDDDAPPFVRPLRAAGGGPGRPRPRRHHAHPFDHRPPTAVPDGRSASPGGPVLVVPTPRDSPGRLSVRSRARTVTPDTIRRWEMRPE